MQAVPKREAPPPPDYFSALELRSRTIAVRLCNSAMLVRRAPLGLHYRLRLTDDPLAFVALAAGVDEDDIEPDEIAPAFEALFALNVPTQVPAIARWQTQGEQVPAGLRYEGRWLAFLVHSLAYHYGWTSHYILDELCPEEALCYMQEIIYERYQEHNFAYSLADVNRDKRGKQKKFPPLEWLRIPYEEEQVRERPPVNERFLPTGNVIRLDDLRRGA